MSNGKTMDIWTATRTFLEKNPATKRKPLLKYVMEKTGYGKSTICDHFTSWDLKGKIHREKGRYWLEKPLKQEPKLQKQIPFWKKQAFKELDMIGNLKDEGYVGLAYTRLKRLKNKLPLTKREKLDSMFDKADADLARTKRHDFYGRMLEKLYRKEALIETLIGEVSAVLYES